MLPAEITTLVPKLSYGDRSELIGLLLDSLDDEAIEQGEGEDSLTIALCRSEEMKSEEVKALTSEEFWEAV